MNNVVLKDNRVSEIDILNGVVLPREHAIERALSHAYRHGYCFGADALDSYCVLRDLEWERSWDGIITIKEIVK